MGAQTIGVDWGSTHVRAFRFDNSGAIAETRRSDRGAAGMNPAAYEGALRDVLGDWPDASPETIVVICGMAGSREGWIEAPYLACPCRLESLPQSLVRAPARFAAYIVPGVSVQNADGVHDVMRGEETQMLGALPAQDAWLIAPGTHSKWAEIRDGAIVRFHTAMTGEFFRLLTTHSVLSRSIDMAAAFDAAAFERGASRALSGDATAKLAFAVRTESLFGALSPDAAKSYLSGLLIGAEIADALRTVGRAPLVIVAAEDIARLYHRALALAERDADIVDGEAAAARGLWRIAQGARAT